MNGSNGHADVRFVPGQRITGSVTERLSARLDALEPVVARMLANETKLIADAVTTEASVRDLYRHQTDAWEQVAAHGEELAALVAFRHRSFLGRLRWLLTGR